MEKDKVDMELIRRYIRGELTPREMYALERQAQTDPMLMDIILGMEQEALDVHDDNLADIHKRIAERTERRRTIVRRLVPAQRWAIAASLLAVLTVGMWWFTREDTVEQQLEATLAAIPEEVPQAVPEAELSPKPVPHTDDREADAVPQRATNAPSAAAAAEKKEGKEERLAMVTPKADTGASLQDSVVVVGYGAQQKSIVTGAVARIASVETDTPASANEQLLAARTNGIRIRGISPPPPKEEHPQPIIGKVVDKETQKPLANVSIQISDEQAVATDKQGRFAAIDTSKTLTARLIGYETQTVQLTGSDSISIAMRPNDATLSEVVVVGYHKQGQPQGAQVTYTESEPTPKGGWPAYRQYLKDAVKLAQGQKGTVDLAFTVDDDGRPTDIAVVKTTNEKLNNFATLIVRDGPRWVCDEKNECKATLRIAF